MENKTVKIEIEKDHINNNNVGVKLDRKLSKMDNRKNGTSRFGFNLNKVVHELSMSQKVKVIFFFNIYHSVVMDDHSFKHGYFPI